MLHMPDPITRDDDFDYEAALIACARGERFALEALYAREARWLLGVANRIVRDRALAEDVLQDAFVLIWQKAQRFDRNLGSARGWIYTVVRHRALNVIRNRGREIGMDDPESLRVGGDADHSGQGRNDAADIDKCLEQLPAERRETILLAFLDGYSHEQIAHTRNTPLGTIKSWIRRGLASLKECLS
jgi:RNA polymerase sigma-70 factor (ECF subfamily)